MPVELVSQRLIETALREEQHKEIRNVSIGAIIAVIIVASLLYNRYRMKKELSDKLLERNIIIASQHNKIEVMNRKLHMKVLQAQMNPHFVFNALNDIQYYINRCDRATSLSYVVRFSKFMRLLIQQANQVAITVNDEVALLKQYMEMEQIRFGYKFSYELHVPVQLPANEIRVPSLLLYHYVENAIYHGILNSNRKGHIIVKFAYQPGHIICSIQDNGIGRKEAKEQAKHKTGNNLTPYSKLQSERIYLMNEERPGSIVVRKEDLKDIYGDTQGTLVIIDFAIDHLVTSFLQEITEHSAQHK